jgi:hypothetical protein
MSEPESNLDLDDAKAKLSEGWCPVCNSRFAQRGNSTDLRCEQGYEYQEMQARLSAWLTRQEQIWMREALDKEKGRP